MWSVRLDGRQKFHAKIIPEANDSFQWWNSRTLCFGSVPAVIRLGGKEYPVQILCADLFQGIGSRLFSSGDDISREWAPQAVSAGAWAVDNSGAFDGFWDLVDRSEVNGDLLDQLKTPQIIAKPQ